MQYVTPPTRPEPIPVPKGLVFDPSLNEDVVPPLQDVKLIPPRLVPPSDPIANLTKEELSKMSALDIAPIIFQLTPDQVRLLSNSQLVHLSAEQLAASSVIQVPQGVGGALDRNGLICRLTPAQIASLSPEQLRSVSATQVANENVINSLVSTQIARLTKTQLNSLSASQVAQQAVITSLTAKQVASLAPTQLTSVNVTQLSSKQLKSLTPTQLESLPIGPLIAPPVVIPSKRVGGSPPELVAQQPNVFHPLNNADKPNVFHPLNNADKPNVFHPLNNADKPYLIATVGPLIGSPVVIPSKRVGGSPPELVAQQPIPPTIFNRANAPVLSVPASEPVFIDPNGPVFVPQQLSHGTGRKMTDEEIATIRATTPVGSVLPSSLSVRTAELGITTVATSSASNAASVGSLISAMGNSTSSAATTSGSLTSNVQVPPIASLV